eukprot:5939481-Prymnesium_polylepis.1
MWDEGTALYCRRRPVGGWCSENSIEIQVTWLWLVAAPHASGSSAGSPRSASRLARGRPGPA